MLAEWNHIEWTSKQKDMQIETWNTRTLLLCTGTLGKIVKIA